MNKMSHITYYKNNKKLNKPLANSPFQTKNLAILWAASDFPRQGGPTIVTTRGALKGQGTAAIIPVKLSAKKKKRNNQYFVNKQQIYVRTTLKITFFLSSTIFY